MESSKNIFEINHVCAARDALTPHGPSRHVMDKRAGAGAPMPIRGVWFCLTLATIGNVAHARSKRHGGATQAHATLWRARVGPWWMGVGSNWARRG